MDKSKTPLRVAVIGAGIVGAAAAWELIKDGYEVTLIEPGEPGGSQAASYGNGAWLSPASIVPMSMPGLWRKVPGYLLDPEGPLTIRWSALPRLTPWLLRFLVAGATVAKVERTARALSSLLHDGPARHAALAAEIGRPDLIGRTGLLYVYPDHKAFAAEALAWRLRRDNGVRWVELFAEELRQREPALDRRYTFGALVESGAHCTDPGAYVAAIVAHCLSKGAKLRRAVAQGFAIEDGRLRGVLTSDGPVACERAVICAGIHSKVLARGTGDRIPLESERGYHCVIANPTVELRIPIMPSDGKMGNTTTRTGLRISGQVELSCVDAEPNWKRADILLDHALATYPGLGPRQDLKVDRWIGHRPSTADGLPVIGQARATSDVIHAFGHGHVGLVAGPITGRMVADIVSGRAPPADLGPFAASRFS